MRVMKQPEARRQEILETAVRVFAKKGYDKTSISDIAGEMNISQGLCYRYFPSKETIYDAAIDEYADYIVNQNIKKTDLAGKTLHEQILLMSGRIDDYSTTEKGQADMYQLFHHPGSHRMHEQLFLKVSQKLVPYIGGTLRAAAERGELTLADPEATAHFFVFGQMAILMDKSIPEDEKIARIQQCLIEMLHI